MDDHIRFDRFQGVDPYGVLPDLILNIHVLVKGKLSREWDVDDDPRAPHVEGAVEAALFQHVRV